MKKLSILFFIVLFLSAFPVWSSGADSVPSGWQPDLLAEEVDDSGSDDFEFDANSIYDPLEPVNRVIFQFNDKLYFWVIKPVKISYTFIIPEELRVCIGNFFSNLAAPVHLINNLLQGRFEDAGIVVSRFIINSTLGVYGLADVAKEQFKLGPQLADFGQTLGYYGVGEGIYLCWPIIGPSNLRDSVGLAGDVLVGPLFHADLNTGQTLAVYSTNTINFLSLGPDDVYENMKKYSLDPYVTARQAFYDFRRNIIRKASEDEAHF